MPLFVAVILLGQVAENNQVGVPVDNTMQVSPAVDVADQEQPPAASLRSPVRPAVGAPVRPSVDAPARSSRASVVDNVNADRPEPAFRRQQPAVLEEPSVVTAAAAVAPAAPATTQANGNPQSLQVATTMMAGILVLDEQTQANLRRVRLVEALSRIGDPSLKSEAIRAYWDLTQAIAAERFSADKLRVLTEVNAPANDADRVLLAEAVADAEAEVSAAQDALLTAQFTLLRVSGLNLQDALPWPADAPLVAPYRTQFTTIFANQPAPLSLRQIHQSLPGKLLLIEKRVAAMGAAENATDTLLESYKRAGVPLTQLLASIERLDRSRRAFVNAIVDYNNQIAEYSLSVVGSGVGSETLVTTLIKVPNANTPLVEIPRQTNGTPLR
jgi:hypothetical protein